jgi:hypothetical protein
LPEKLGATLVGCLPRALAFAAKPLGGMLRDQRGEIGALLGEKPTVIVLRPDRYVAVASASEEIAAGVRAVEHMIADTFATGRHSPRRRDHPMIAA